MWSTPLVALAAGSLLTVAIFRHELQGLAESVRTYAAFYPYLEQHQELVYRLPSDSRAETKNDGNKLVPPIFHRIDLSESQEESASMYEDAISSCQTIHPNWTHTLWTDASATEFMRNLYPHLRARYEGYRRSTEYANILKYALLDHYGGVYLNLDISCVQPLDELRGMPFLTPGAYPVGVSKAFILSKPHHPFLRRLLEGIERQSLRRRRWGIEKVLNTGSMYFSNNWMRYARLLDRRGIENVSEERRVYVLADEHGNLGPHVLGTGATSPLFSRQGASSWRDFDNSILVIISKNQSYFLAMMGLGAACMTIWLWTMSGRRRTSSAWLSLAKEPRRLEKLEDAEKLLGTKGG